MESDPAGRAPGGDGRTRSVDYGWSTAGEVCGHDYLFPVVLRLVKERTGGARGRILDLGCGNGALASHLLEAGHAVVGVDASASGILWGRAAVPGARFLECSIYDDQLLALPEAPFDIVISLEVIEHLCLPRELFQRAYRLLRPEGGLIVSTPYHGYLKNLALSVVNGWDRHFAVGWDCGHIKFFSPRTLRAMAQEEGFRRCRWEGAGRLPFLWKSIVLQATK